MADYLDTATADTLVAIEGAARVTRHVYGIMSYVAASSKSGTTEEINEEHKIEVLKMPLHGQLFMQEQAVRNTCS